MYLTKHKPNPILNSNILLFTVLCLCCVLYLSIIVDAWYLLFLVLLPLTIRKVTIYWQQFVMYGIILTIFILLIVFANQFSLFQTIYSGLKSINANIIKNSILKFFDNHYEKEVASFIKLVLFNIKSKDTIIFYNQVIDLGVVWMFCISGFHINLLCRIIKLIFKKIPRVGKYVNITIISFYSFLLNFSYASMRIVLKLSYDWIFKKFNIQKYERLGLIGLTICLMNPVCFQSYSFLLSFVVCTSSYFVIGLKFNNKIITSLLINFCAFLVTIPFVLQMNNKISLLTFVSAFVFSYFSAFIFLYLLIFAWMPFMAVIHYGIMVGTYVLVGNMSFAKVYIYSEGWPTWLNFIYYLIICGVFKGVYLIVYNNKI